MGQDSVRLKYAGLSHATWLFRSPFEFIVHYPHQHSTGEIEVQNHDWYDTHISATLTTLQRSPYIREVNSPMRKKFLTPRKISNRMRSGHVKTKSKHCESRFTRCSANSILAAAFFFVKITTF
ncbi:hypothetical protein NPIL_303941 [Nephila pilipes]|uniref:Uncharacterized protein n=1 Tax=Nephila pilipes TaxID=299642 RepID=A0A8X6N8F0_NEPPI|nr:hypothetical protein NPIL_303941 [Nephila pilipes]